MTLGPVLGPAKLDGGFGSHIAEAPAAAPLRQIEKSLKPNRYRQAENSFEKRLVNMMLKPNRAIRSNPKLRFHIEGGKLERIVHAKTNPKRLAAIRRKTSFFFHKEALRQYVNDGNIQIVIAT